MLERRQPPHVEVGTLDGTILERTYNLIEHMQELKGSRDEQQIQRLVSLVESDVAGLSEMLRNVKAEIKDIKGKQPVSGQAALEKQQPEQ